MYSAHFGSEVSKSALLGGVLTSVALLLTPFTVHAQNGQNPQADLDSFMNGLTERLVLSDAQVAQVRPILEAQFQKQHELVQRDRSSGNSGELQGEMDRQRQETHELLSNVLTERQMSEYHAMRQEQQRATRGQGQGGQDVERGQGQGRHAGDVERGQGQGRQGGQVQRTGSHHGQSHHGQSQGGQGGQRGGGNRG